MRNSCSARIVPSVFALTMMLLLTQSDTLVANPPDAGTVETLIHFNPTAFEAPESIVIDSDGNLFISMALTGEIRKITPQGRQSTLARIPIGAPLEPCGSLIAAQGALVLAPDGTIYVNAAACDPVHRGIWRVSPRGDARLLAQLPLEALPNGLTLRRGHLYAADSALGVIWRVPARGGRIEVWADHPLLKATPGSGFPGPNGVQIFNHELYVANSDQGTIIAFPFNSDDSPGEPRVHAALPDNLGCDDFAFDVLGNLYCTTDPFNRLLRIFPDGTFETLLTAADGLDGPTSAAFGRRGHDRFNLYIGNAAFPFFSTTFRPSLMRLHLNVPGAPRQ